ncbi:hypothetical protein [Bradyrhizobium sp. OAE829]|uniref:hypothetical protein n=1 Tax=Bradyrhizobium sp. OAE829 TaxID=2663807 RepID=UPI00178B5965
MKRPKKRKMEVPSLAGQAQRYTAEAIVELVDIIHRTDSHAARLAAITTLLDRGFGKPPKSLAIATADPIRRVDSLSEEDSVAYFRRFRAGLERTK